MIINLKTIDQLSYTILLRGNALFLCYLIIINYLISWS